MASFVRQRTIWQELERVTPPGLEDVVEFLMELSRYDRALVRDLLRERGHGRDDFPVAAMWNLVALKMYLRHRRFSELLAELKRNSDLARVLGFREIGPNRYSVPSDTAVSLFHMKLQSEPSLGKVHEVFTQTVAMLKKECPSFGKHQAMDASDVRTHARPPRRKRGEGQEQEKEIPSADPEASWSVKTKVTKDAKGKVRKETEATFGYKFYAAVDVKIPAVTAVDVQTGKTSDFNMAMPMLDAAQENIGEDPIETMAMDKGFDSAENVSGSYERGCAAIVPVRDVPENLNQLPKEDRERVVVSGGNVVYDRYTGEVACYACSDKGGEHLERRVMIYAGFESDRNTHKFRCPLGGGASSRCKAFRSCAAGLSGCQGRQIRISMETDCRRFAPVYPRSKRWKRLFNGRTSVERVNSYVKEVLQLDEHCLRGKAAIKLRAILASVTLNIRTLISLRRQSALAKAA